MSLTKEYFEEKKQKINERLQAWIQEHDVDKHGIARLRRKFSSTFKKVTTMDYKDDLCDSSSSFVYPESKNRGRTGAREIDSNSSNVSSRLDFTNSLDNTVSESNSPLKGNEDLSTVTSDGDVKISRRKKKRRSKASQRNILNIQTNEIHDDTKGHHRKKKRRSSRKEPEVIAPDELPEFSFKFDSASSTEQETLAVPILGAQLALPKGQETKGSAHSSHRLPIADASHQCLQALRKGRKQRKLKKQRSRMNTEVHKTESEETDEGPDGAKSEVSISKFMKTAKRLRTVSRLGRPATPHVVRLRVLNRFRRLVRLLINIRVLLNVTRLRVEQEEKSKTFKAVEHDGSVLTFDPNNFKSAMTTNGLSDRAKKAMIKTPQERNEHDWRIMMEVMFRLDIFKRYSKVVKGELARLMWYDSFKNGRVIMKQGDPGSRMYFVISGEVVLYRTEVKGDGEETIHIVKTLEAGSTFGELALIRDMKREHSAVCKGDSEFLSVSKSEFNNVLRRRWEKDCYVRINFMRSSRYFTSWTEQQLQRLADNSELKIFRNNETVIGNVSGKKNNVYFINSGRCEMVRQMHVVRHQSPYLAPALLLPSDPRAHMNFLDKPYSRRFRSEREERHFLTITTLVAGDFFGVGEDLTDTFIIARAKTECIVINPVQYSIHGKAEDLRCMKAEREDLIPSNNALFRLFQVNRKWFDYRRKCVRKVTGSSGRKHAAMGDVPRSIREESTIPLDIL